MNLLVSISNRVRVLYDARYRYMYFQRMVTGLSSRNAKANHIAKRLPGATILPEAEELYARLDTDGFAVLPDLVTPAILNGMWEHLASRPTHDPYRPNLGRFKSPDETPKGTHVALFDAADIISMPHALAIANDSRILSAVGRVLGAKPTISYMTAWWSVAHGENAKEAELFHRDVDDFRFVKLFVYLTDVDDQSGPHVFVKGSQKIDRLTEIRRLSDEEVEQTFGADKILTFKGPAGTAFLENTYGVHRGVPPASKPRLLFQVLYSLKEYVGGPGRPIAPYVTAQDGVPIDPYVNRVYLRS